MIFAVKVNIFLHNLVFLEIVCYVFFYVGYDPRVLLVLPLMYRWTFRLFSRTGTSLEKFMLPTNETQHQTSLWVSWQKSPWNPREMSYLDLIGGKRTLRKSGQAKGEEQRPYTLPWTKFHVDCYFSSFCDMCQKFPYFVRWKRQCKQNVQIEIPDKTLEKTSTIC